MISSLLLVTMLTIGLVLSVRPKLFVFYLFLLGPLPLAPLVPDPYLDTPLGLVNIGAMKVASLLLMTGFGLLVTPVRLGAALARFSALLLFLLYAVLSLLWAENPTIGIRMLLKLATPLVVALYLWGNITRIGAPAFFAAITLSGLAYLAYGGLNAASWSFAALSIPGASRAEYSGHLVSALASLSGQFAHQGGLWRLLVLLLLGAGTLLAFTRITIAGMFGALGASAFLRSRGVIRIIGPIMGIVAFVALFLLVDTFRERMFLNSAQNVSLSSLIEAPLETAGKVAGSGRFAAWDQALARLYEPSPLIGSGIGATQDLFYGGSARATNVSAVHSEFIRLLCDLGWLGIGLYALSWLQLLLPMRRLSQQYHAAPGTLGHRSAAQQRALATGAVAASAAYLLFLLTDNGLDYVAQIGIFVYGNVAAALGFAGAVQASRPRAPQPQAAPLPLYTR